MPKQKPTHTFYMPNGDTHTIHAADGQSIVQALLELAANSRKLAARFDEEAEMYMRFAREVAPNG